MASIDGTVPLRPPGSTELVTRATADTAAIERLGIAEFRLGVEIVEPDGTRRLFGLVLDGYDIAADGPVDEAVFGPDVVLSGPLEAWTEMIGWIETNGPADSAHSLNGLSIAGIPFEVRSSDAMGSDKFYRYMGTLQAVFDAAAADTPSPSPRTDVALEIDIEECLGCGACESACPQGAVTQGGDFPVAYEVDPLLCNDCQKCLVVCPVDGLVARCPTGPCATGAGARCRRAGTPTPNAARADRCARHAARCCGGSRVVTGRAECARRAANGSRMASCPKVKRARRLLAGASSDGVPDG